MSNDCLMFRQGFKHDAKRQGNTALLNSFRCLNVPVMCCVTCFVLLKWLLFASKLTFDESFFECDVIFLSFCSIDKNADDEELSLWIKNTHAIRTICFVLDKWQLLKWELFIINSVEFRNMSLLIHGLSF